MRRILVADDDQSARGIYTTALLNDDYEAVGVGCGRDAINLIVKDKRPDGMFLDLHLGDMTGLEVLELLRTQGLFVPTVVMTAIRLQFDQDRAIELGAVGYVDQPLTIESRQALDLPGVFRTS
jgi:CheY-like chemotaxis protein